MILKKFDNILFSYRKKYIFIKSFRKAKTFFHGAGMQGFALFNRIKGGCRFLQKPTLKAFRSQFLTLTIQFGEPGPYEEF